MFSKLNRAPDTTIREPQWDMWFQTYGKHYGYFTMEQLFQLFRERLREEEAAKKD